MTRAKGFWDKKARKPGWKVPTDVPIPDRSKLFWQHLRHVRRSKKDIVLENYVFDGKDTVYSVKCDKNNTIIFQMKDPDPKQHMLYTLELTFRTSFRLNFSRKNPMEDEAADRSYKFLKNVMTQKVRYIPSEEEMKKEVAMMFAKNFFYDQNTIFRVPDSFYDQDRFEHSLEVAPRIEAWFGVYIGIKELFSGEPVLNFGIVDKLFYNAPKMSLLDYILLNVDDEAYIDERRKKLKKSLQEDRRSIDQKFRPRIRQMLENLKLKAPEVWDDKKSKMTERHFTFVDLHDYNSLNYTKAPLFQIYKDNGKTIEYPHLKLVKVKSGAKEYDVPMELLEIHETKQRFKNRIDFVMKNAFIKRATRMPHVYQKDIIEMMKKLDFSSEDLNFVKNFKLCYELKMIECPGKVMKEPMVVNRNNEKIKMTPEIRGLQEKMLNVVPDKELCCAIFVLSDEYGKPCVEADKAVMFYTKLINGCEFRDLRVGKSEKKNERSLLWEWKENGKDNKEREKTFAFYGNCQLRNGASNFTACAQHAKDMFERLADNNQKTLLFIIITERRQNAYGFVKQICNHDLGVANQHITSETVRNALTLLRETKSRLTFNQIALKINAKLGGVNQELEWSEMAETSPEEKEKRKAKLTMYVGIDVTHPTSNSGIDCSIAAIVASVNLGRTKYRNRIVVQEECRPGERPVAHGREKTDILEGKFVELLKELAENTDNLVPAHIVIYRDGVSDSEMLRVCHDELHSLKREVRKFLEERGAAEPEPTCTYIMVQKRHKTRFFQRVEEPLARKGKDDVKESKTAGSESAVQEDHNADDNAKKENVELKKTMILDTVSAVGGELSPGEYVETIEQIPEDLKSIKTSEMETTVEPAQSSDDIVKTVNPETENAKESQSDVSKSTNEQDCSHVNSLAPELSKKNPKVKQSETPRFINPPSGTVVDKLVVSGYKFDFYLNSHHAVLGTSRPAHYTVMYDDMGMSQDEVYKMTDALAFLSARCRKPISLPAPVQYAHLSCEKAKEQYRAYNEHFIDDRQQPLNRREMEEFLQANSDYPGMSFV